jgi:hypothetical protein
VTATTRSVIVRWPDGNRYGNDAAANAPTQPQTANYARTFGPDLGIRYT